MPLVHDVSTGLAANPVAYPSLLRVNAFPPLLLRVCLPLWCLTITHNFRERRERSKGQVVDNKKGAADNKL